jgi:Berberine and berberine like
MFAETRHAGGAIAAVDAASAAYGNRNAKYSLQVVGVTPTPAAHAAVREHIAQLKRELAPHLHGGVYMNWLEGEEARERTRQGFSAETYKRLAALKAKYDPDNRFSHSYNFRPAADRA